MYMLTTPKSLPLVLSFRWMYATTYWPLRFSKYRMELDLSFHSPTPTPSLLSNVVKWSPETHDLFISPSDLVSKKQPGSFSKSPPDCLVLLLPSMGSHGSGEDADLSQTPRGKALRWHHPPQVHHPLSVVWVPSSSPLPGLHLLFFLQEHSTSSSLPD